MAEIDWIPIRAEYIAGTAGYRKLADKYDVSVNALSDRAKKEDWPGQRQQYRDKRGTDLVARYARMDKRKMEALFRASEKMADRLAEMMDDDTQFRRYVVKDADSGELREQTMDVYNTKAMKNTVGMLLEMNHLLRSLNRIPDQAQAEAQYVARRKLELEEERLLQAGKTDEEHTGVIMMQAQEQPEEPEVPEDG